MNETYVSYFLPDEIALGNGSQLKYRFSLLLRQPFPFDDTVSHDNNVISSPKAHTLSPSKQTIRGSLDCSLIISTEEGLGLKHHLRAVYLRPVALRIAGRALTMVGPSLGLAGWLLHLRK
jgi:hypothetical protein